MGKTALMSRATRPWPARLLAFAGTVAAAASLVCSVATSGAAAATPCWERVVDDWIDNGRIDGLYSRACLQAALGNVPEDVRAYSDFEEKIRSAMREAVRLRLPQGADADSTRADPSQAEELEEDEPTARGNDEGPIDSVLGYRNEDASSVPLPLIVLAALAFILLAAGAAGFVHRKLQARKARAS